MMINDRELIKEAEEQIETYMRPSARVSAELLKRFKRVIEGKRRTNQ
jgi:hypothetical protein